MRLLACALLALAALAAPQSASAAGYMTDIRPATDGLLYAAVAAADDYWRAQGYTLAPAEVYTYVESERESIVARGDQPGRRVFFNRAWLARTRESLAHYGTPWRRSILAVVCQIAVHERGHNIGLPHGGGVMAAVLRDYNIPQRCIQFARDNAPSVTDLTHASRAIRYAYGMKRSRDTQPKVRSHIGLAAHQATGAGKHGGSARAQRRRDRQNTKRALRAGSEA